MHQGVNPVKGPPPDAEGPRDLQHDHSVRSGHFRTWPPISGRPVPRSWIAACTPTSSTACRRPSRSECRFLQPGASLRELMSGRDWLFEAGNYHIDVSHLNSVVRFARVIEPPRKNWRWLSSWLSMAASSIRSLQYGGEPPFDDIYPAHVKFFRVLHNKNGADALQYFKSASTRSRTSRTSRSWRMSWSTC